MIMNVGVFIDDSREYSFIYETCREICLAIIRCFVGVVKIKIQRFSYLVI